MRHLLTIAAAGGAGYVLLCLLLYLLQERMVFLPQLPGRALDATPASIGLAYEDVRIETADGVALHGWYVRATRPRGTVLFFHGNAGNVSHRLESLEIFASLGLDTLIIDYRGYGLSEGRPDEAGTYRDAEAAWRYLVEERGRDPGRLVVFGRSLGGAVAAWLASRRRPAAVIVESTFTSAAEMAAHLYPFLPVRWLTRLRYPTAEYLAQAPCPVLVVHSADDEIIPWAMARALYDAAPEPKSFLELSGDHNTGFLGDVGRYTAALDGFIGSALPPGAIPPAETGR